MDTDIEKFYIQKSEQLAEAEEYLDHDQLELGNRKAEALKALYLVGAGKNDSERQAAEKAAMLTQDIQYAENIVIRDKACVAAAKAMQRVAEHRLRMAEVGGNG